MVLAAGGSRRMGSPKQLLPLAGRSLVARAVQAALACRCQRVFVVLGAHATQVSAALAGLEVEAVVNSDWSSGLSSSIRCGVRALMASHSRPTPRFDAALLVLADQPAVDPRLLDELIDAFDGSESGIVACEYASTLGAPVLFGSSYFEALCGLTGDAGAKSLLQGRGRELRRVAFEPDAIDVDTPADYQAAIAQVGEGLGEEVGEGPDDGNGEAVGD